ncbi:MAG TPA: META domain-containing protein, partial [Coriobacteriia bacterium]|nr:META domain-containing protein [Coriobacteriia bacterium]
GGLTGCGGEAAQNPDALTANRWTVNKFADASSRLVAPIPTTSGSKGPNLEFAPDDKVSGYTGVNSFGAQYDADQDGNMEFGAIASTKMAASPELMDQEAAFLEALENTVAYRLENHGLTLLGADGRTLVRAKPEKQAPLIGTTWGCTGYNNGKEAIVSVLADAPISAEFDEEDMNGSTGVNTYVASYELDGTRMVIDSAFPTTDSEGSPEAMDQEAAYLTALSDVASYQIDADVLTLYGAGRVRLATYLAEP